MSHHENTHFIVPVKYYIGTFLALLVLTFLTVYVALFDFGSFNIVIAMLVAGLKAFLVAWIFMGLKWDSVYNRVVFLGTLLCFVLFLGVILLDAGTRGDIDKIEAGIYDINSPVKSPTNVTPSFKH